MQEKQNFKIIILIYAGIFLLVTGGIMYLDTIYQNIFKLNFTPVLQKEKKYELTVKENYSAFLDSLSNILRKEMIDSLKTLSFRMQDSIKSGIDYSFADSVKQMKTLIEANAKDDSLKRVVKEYSEKTKNDTVYVKWVKKTSVLYESMEPKKAAKIIQGYSDNIARDIIYNMKKKKAAEILANLTPEVANRVTRIR